MFRECVTNQTLCQAMRQLASLLKQADDLFQELGGQVGHCAIMMEILVTRINNDDDVYLV